MFLSLLSNINRPGMSRFFSGLLLVFSLSFLPGCLAEDAFVGNIQGNFSIEESQVALKGRGFEQLGLECVEKCDYVVLSGTFPDDGWWPILSEVSCRFQHKLVGCFIHADICRLSSRENGSIYHDVDAVSLTLLGSVLPLFKSPMTEIPQSTMDRWDVCKYGHCVLKQKSFMFPQVIHSCKDVKKNIAMANHGKSPSFLVNTIKIPWLC